MKREYLAFMWCPECHAALMVDGTEGEHRIISSGTIACTDDRCGQRYPIVNAVPRFVGLQIHTGRVAFRRIQIKAL